MLLNLCHCKISLGGIAFGILYMLQHKRSRNANQIGPWDIRIMYYQNTVLYSSVSCSSYLYECGHLQVKKWGLAKEKINQMIGKKTKN